MIRSGVAVSVVAMVSSSAMSVPIMFIHEGSGNGMIDGVSFVDAGFVITAFGDTDSKTETFPGVFLFDHTSASIAIAGVGTFDFNQVTHSFYNSNSPVAGFSRTVLPGIISDLFNGPYTPALAGWDMASSIGPISGEGEVLQWESFMVPVETTGGTLFFETDFDTEATFTAIVPAPGGAAVMAFGFVAAARRRR